jgi:phosphohistidine phosphatase
MRLYLVRHAEAAPGDPDELRPLTQEGREQARALGKRMLREDAAPAVILTSPLLRARETGGELARAFDIESIPDERLAPGATVDDVVGHQPDCGQIAAALTGGPEPRFPAGGFAVLELK